MNNTKESTDSSRGPQGQNNIPIIQQEPKGGNNHLELPIPKGSALVHELGNELNTTRLLDERIGIRQGETLTGTLEARNAGTDWRFLDEQLNFIEPGLSYHGEFIARVTFISSVWAHLALIAWRPVFGNTQDYIRFARFSRRPFEPIQLNYDETKSKLVLKVGDLVEFAAKVIVDIHSVDFQIAITGMKLLQLKGIEELQGHAS